MKYITIIDLARRLNLSKSTVSRALAGDGNVSKETQDRVRELAQQLGYTRNDMAVNLRQKQTKSIGIIIPEIVTPFFMHVVSEVQRELNGRHGYRVLLAQSNENSDIELANLRMMEEFRVDGILLSVCSSRNNIPEYLRLKEKGMALVFFDRIVPQFSASKIEINEYAKSVLLVEHLIEQGRKKIVHIAGPEYIYNSTERLRGYKKALAKNGIAYDPTYVIPCDLAAEAAAAKMTYLLDNNIDFDAVFCFTETQALGVKKLLSKQKIAIPDQVAIACMSGTTLSTLVHPTLTSVEQPVDQIASAAIQLLLEKIENPAAEDRKIVVDAQIKIRESSAVD